MSDISLLAKNLDGYEGAELQTNSNSIVKAINELYVNQQILFATCNNLFQKFNLSLGDLTEDEALRDSYAKLKFNNIFDGLVKLENNLQTALTDGTAGTLAKINEIKTQIGDLQDDEELKTIFDAKGWVNLSDALVKVDTRITNYINNSTANTSAVTIALRDSITELREVVGTLSTDETTKEEFNRYKFHNILAAIVELSTIIGYNTAAEEVFDQTNFESILELAIDTYNTTLNNTELIEKFSKQETTQAAVIAAKLEKFYTNLDLIDKTVKDLVKDLGSLQTSLQMQSDYMRTGFENIETSLGRMSTSVSNIVKLVGDLSEDIEIKNEYDAIGYTSMVEGICKLTTMTNYLVNLLGNVEVDTDLQEAFNETGYNTVIEAVIDINSILGNMSTNNILKAAFVRLGFKNVAEGLVQLSDSLDTQLTTINLLRSQLIAHEIDLKAHDELIPTFLMHFTGKKYARGERIYLKELPNYIFLECVSDNGTTGEEKPDFAALIADEG